MMSLRSTIVLLCILVLDLSSPTVAFTHHPSAFILHSPLRISSSSTTTTQRRSPSTLPNQRRNFLPSSSSSLNFNLLGLGFGLEIDPSSSLTSFISTSSKSLTDLISSTQSTASNDFSDLIASSRDIASSLLSSFGVDTPQSITTASSIIAPPLPLSPLLSSATKSLKAYLSTVQTLLTSLHTLQTTLSPVTLESWGVTIILLTLLTRIALTPLTLGSISNVEITKQLEPFRDEIRRKYMSNSTSLTSALDILNINYLYPTNIVLNTFVTLVQIPLAWSVYRVLTNLAIEGVLGDKFWFLPSLSGPVGASGMGLDWLTQGWTEGGSSNGVFGLPVPVPVPMLGWNDTLLFLILPIALVLLQYITAVITTPDTSQMSQQSREQYVSSQEYLQYLPLLTGWFALQVPAGVSLFWLFTNLFMVIVTVVVQQVYEFGGVEVDKALYMGFDEGVVGEGIGGGSEVVLPVSGISFSDAIGSTGGEMKMKTKEEQDLDDACKRSEERIVIKKAEIENKRQNLEIAAEVEADRIEVARVAQVEMFKEFKAEALRIQAAYPDDDFGVFGSESEPYVPLYDSATDETIDDDDDEEDAVDGLNDETETIAVASKVIKKEKPVMNYFSSGAE